LLPEQVETVEDVNSYRYYEDSDNIQSWKL
jgi:hypothetical protein